MRRWNICRWRESKLLNEPREQPLKTLNRQRGAAGAWMLAIIVVLVLAFVAWRWLMFSPSSDSPEALPLPAATLPATPSTAEKYPVSAIAHSTPAPAASVVPDADEVGARQSLLALPGAQGLASLLDRPEMIQRIVATIDALPGKRLSAKVLPVKPPDGSFQVTREGDTTVIAPGNADRYAPYLAIAERLDKDALLDWYVQHYDEFDQAYRQLGYPAGHFNDRLVAVIDNLLQAPEPATSPGLVARKGGWAYANPKLESLSVGQKMMLRLPPAERAKLRARLHQWRRALTGATLPEAEAGD